MERSWNYKQKVVLFFLFLKNIFRLDNIAMYQLFSAFDSFFLFVVFLDICCCNTGNSPIVSKGIAYITLSCSVPVLSSLLDHAVLIEEQLTTDSRIVHRFHLPRYKSTGLSLSLRLVSLLNRWKNKNNNNRYLLQTAVWTLLYRNRPSETHRKEKSDGCIVYKQISH